MDRYGKPAVIRKLESLDAVQDLPDRYRVYADVERSEPSVAAGAVVDDSRPLFKMRIVMAACQIHFRIAEMLPDDIEQPSRNVRLVYADGAAGVEYQLAFVDILYRYRISFRRRSDGRSNGAYHSARSAVDAEVRIDHILSVARRDRVHRTFLRARSAHQAVVRYLVAEAVFESRPLGRRGSLQLFIHLFFRHISYLFAYFFRLLFKSHLTLTIPNSAYQGNMFFELSDNLSLRRKVPPNICLLAQIPMH